MAKPSKQVEQKEHLVTNLRYLTLGIESYNCAFKMEKEDSPEQKKIDAHWHSAAMYFWMAFAIGNTKAPFQLFKCFALGAGVEKDSIIAAYMYVVSKKLGDLTWKDLDDKFIPKIYDYMKPAIDQITALVLNTQKKFPNGADAGELSDQMDLYEEKIGLWTGKLMYTAFLSKGVAVKSIIKFHEDHPGWRYLGLGDEAEFADPIDDAGAAAAGVAALHFDDHHG